MFNTESTKGGTATISFCGKMWQPSMLNIILKRVSTYAFYCWIKRIKTAFVVLYITQIAYK